MDSRELEKSLKVMESCRGILLIPLQNFGKPYSGRVEDKFNEKYLKDAIQYADKHSLYILFLSYSKGIIPFGTLLQNETLIKEEKAKNVWAYVVAEQCYRWCIDLHSIEVTLLNKSYTEYALVKELLRRKGILLRTPVEGINIKNRLGEYLDAY